VGGPASTSPDDRPADFGPVAMAMATTVAPPVMEARRWLAATPLPPGLDLINVSQAAPVEPPTEGLRQALADAILNRDTVHLYGPVLGLSDLREDLADAISVRYGGALAARQVAITAGCNQAFAAAAATLAGSGDAMILPVPWYFNHAMWLSMSGVAAVPLPTDAALLPDPERCATLIGPRTRAIVLVSPNNPGGVEYPPQLLRDFLDLARRHRIALVLDETYRDFHSRDGAPHALFADPDWDDTLIHLYSFSKAYRLTGHRVGAVAAHPGRLAEMEKFLDTVAICAPQAGQFAALWGLRNLGDWLAGERAEILARRAAMTQGFGRLPGWQLRGCGAYFAYAEHPFAAPSDVLARRLLAETAILALPGTMFAPAGDASGARGLRIAFANLDRQGISVLFDRLAALPA